PGRRPQRHPGADPVLAGGVRRGRDHAALRRVAATADDHRLPDELGPPQHLHGRDELVEVDVQHPTGVRLLVHVCLTGGSASGASKGSIPVISSRSATTDRICASPPSLDRSSERSTSPVAIPTAIRAGRAATAIRSASSSVATTSTAAASSAVTSAYERGI